MRRKFSWSITASILLALVSILSCATREGQRTEKKQNTGSIVDKDNFPTIDKGQYAIFIDVSEEEAEDYLAKNRDIKLPVLILYFVEGHFMRHKYVPRIYMAIWEDGTIVWGACQDTKTIISDIEDRELEIKYFQSKIDVDGVEQLLDVLLKSSVWDGRRGIVPGTSHTYLTVRSEGKEHETYGHATSIFTTPMLISALLSGYGITAKNDWQWRQTIKGILEVIPSEGDPVDILFEKRSILGWSGIVEHIEEQDKNEQQAAQKLHDEK